MRRRDKADVHMDGLVAAQPLELLFLQRAEQLRLQLQANVADFIEEQSAAIGKLQTAALLHQSAGKCTLLVSEELAFDQPGRNGSTIEPDKRSVPSWTQAMDCAGKQFFAGASLAV